MSKAVHIESPLPWQFDLWQQAIRLIESDALPHAILCAGPEGQGKGRFAATLAQRLACTQATETSDQGLPCEHCPACSQVQSGNFPGLHTITVMPPANSIKIDQVRAAIEFTEQTRESWRIVLIQQADRMTEAAQNALLKSLEEPGKSTVFILVSNQIRRLLPTVRSRCQLWSFNPPSSVTFEHWWRSKTVDSLHAQDVDAEATTLSGKQLFRIAASAPLQAVALYHSNQLDTADEKKACFSLATRQEWSLLWQDLHQRATTVGNMVAFAKRQPMGTAIQFMSSCILDVLKLMMLAEGSAEESPIRNADVIIPLKTIAHTGPSILDLIHCYQGLQDNWRVIEEGRVLNAELFWESIFLKWVINTQKNHTKG